MSGSRHSKSFRILNAVTVARRSVLVKVHGKDKLPVALVPYTVDVFQFHIVTEDSEGIVYLIIFWRPHIRRCQAP